ncbi:hypothetical protein ACEN4P_01475 [Marinilactibacillus psychrotolerans]|uniref:hypothetical protein n=1 Tax=Marinilactibacillus psychrotolerans TaxID=191770 RepID=UPI00388A5785
MFSAEENAMEIINPSVDKYEKHFKEIFPLYEYINITENKDYDFSVSGAKKLNTFIENRIETNDPVKIPKGYEDRVY